MPYTPDATDVTQPVDSTVKASTAAPEFRTLKLYLRDVLLAGLNLKAPLASPSFTGTANFVNSPTMPTPPVGASDNRGATTAFVAAEKLSTVLPGAVGNDGLSISSDGVDANFRTSAAEALAILNFLGA